MKKIFISLISLIALLIPLNKAHAGASISTSASSIYEGNSITASITITEAAAWEVHINVSGAASSSNCSGLDFADSTSDTLNTTRTYTVTCTPTKTGTINFTINSNSNITNQEGNTTYLSGSTYVSVINKPVAQPQAPVTTPKPSTTPNITVTPKSSVNYLSSLTVEGSLVADFDGAKTDYTYTVSTETNSVVIDYIKVNQHASVSGAGEIVLDSDSKKVSLVVTAQNGDKKTYNVTIKKSSTGSLSVGAIISKYGKKSDGTYLNGFGLNTFASSVINELKAIDEKAEVSMTDSSNKTKTDGILATGDKITIKSGSETKTFIVVIYGDINGDGLINSTDLLKIRQHLIGPSKLSGEYFNAANVTKDNVLNSTDLLRIRQHLIGTKSIEQ